MTNVSEFIRTITDAVRRDLQPLIPSLRWGTVNAVTPALSVTFDGPDETPLVFPPGNIARGLQPGARVYMVVWRHQAVILGRSLSGGEATGQWVEVSDGEAEPSFRLTRLFGAVRHTAFLYVTSANPRAEVALILKKDDLNVSRLMLDERGQAVVNTYSDSPSGVATRPLPFAMASGIVSITPTTANTPTSQTVNFPANLFTTTPAITVTPNTTVPHRAIASISAPTAAKFDVMLWRDTTATTTVHWTAVQMTA